MTVFNPVYDGTYLMCLMGGYFSTTDVTTMVKMMGNFIILEGAEFSADTPPCTKMSATSGALPDCKGFLPATTLSIFPKFEGSKAVVNFSIQMAKENMVPAMLYMPSTGYTAPSGEPRVT